MLKGFDPIIPEKPRLMILGSMPSVTSLDKQEYYGFEMCIRDRIGDVGTAVGTEIHKRSHCNQKEKEGSVPAKQHSV